MFFIKLALAHKNKSSHTARMSNAKQNFLCIIGLLTNSHKPIRRIIVVAAARPKSGKSFWTVASPIKGPLLRAAQNCGKMHVARSPSCAPGSPFPADRVRCSDFYWTARFQHFCMFQTGSRSHRVHRSPSSVRRRNRLWNEFSDNLLGENRTSQF